MTEIAAASLKHGDAIALKSDLGFYVCADLEHKDVAGIPLYANRENADGWETFTVEKKAR